MHSKKFDFRQNINVLFVGDSITCEGQRPRGFITKIVSVIPIRKTVICKKGATSEEISKLFQEFKFSKKPDLIIVQSGINDVLNNVSISIVKQAQSNLLYDIKKKFPNSKTLYLPMHPIIRKEDIVFSDFAYNPNNFDSWWNFESSFVEKFLVDDGVHLNAHGHSFFAHQIMLEIEKFKII